MGDKLIDPFGLFEGAKDIGDKWDGGQGPGISIRDNTKTTQKEIAAAYGTVKVGGNWVYFGTAGSNNNDLWVVMSLGEGECNGIHQVDSVDQVFLDDKIYTEYGGNVSYYFHAGTGAQTYDANLYAALAEHNDAYRYLCYLVFHCVYNGDYFQSTPNFTVVLEGKKVYDFRDGTTIFSSNPVLCMHDFITAERYGPGLATAKIHYPSWIAAANYCDEKGFTFNNVISKNQNMGTILDDMRAHFRGRLNWWNGQYFLRYADLNYESVAMNLEDKHLQQRDDGAYSVNISEPTVFNLPDGIRVKWRDPDNLYVEDDLPIGDEVGVIKEINLLGCTDREMAGNLGVYYLERALLNRLATATLRMDAIRLEPWDIVKATWSDLGITAQYLRVMDVALNDDGSVDVGFAFEALALYNDDFDLVVANVYKCTFPDPSSIPGSVSSVSLTEELYDYRLQTYTRLLVSATGPNHANFAGVNVWKSFDDVDYEFFSFVQGAPGGAIDFSLDPVEEGTTYYLILTSVSKYGPEQALGSGYKGSKTILGLTALPASLSAIAAIANDNTVSVYGRKLNNPDIEIYEFRLGGWTGGIFLAALRSPNLNLQGVKPGTHIFYANTKSTNGFYGETPRSASCALLDPPKSWTVADTDTCDYDGVGTHKNTEHTIYSSDDYLICSHDGFPTNTGDLALNIGGTDYDRAQAFYPFLRIDSLASLQLYLKKTGSPTGNLKAYIYDDDSGPDSLVATSDNFDVSTLTGSLAWTTFTFSTPPALEKDTKYYVVIKGSDISQDGSNYVSWGYDSAGSWGTNRWYSTGTWTEQSGEDHNFRIDPYCGRYTSPEYDRGSSDDYLTYLLADVIVAAAETTWGGVIPSPTTWDEIGITERTWQEIFALENAPEVHIKVFWGDVSGSLSNSAEKMEILSTIATGRYFQWEITIRDPADSTNAYVENFTAKYCQ